jgi:hypothetical protein
LVKSEKATADYAAVSPQDGTTLAAVDLSRNFGGDIRSAGVEAATFDRVADPVTENWPLNLSRAAATPMTTSSPSSVPEEQSLPDSPRDLRVLSMAIGDGSTASFAAVVPPAAHSSHRSHSVGFDVTQQLIPNLPTGAVHRWSASSTSGSGGVSNGGDGYNIRSLDVLSAAAAAVALKSESSSVLHDQGRRDVSGMCVTSFPLSASSVMTSAVDSTVLRLRALAA